MNLFSVISSAATVLTFLSFLGIVAWAYSRRQAAAFEEAANAPFALPEDSEQSANCGDHAGLRP